MNIQHLHLLFQAVLYFLDLKQRLYRGKPVDIYPFQQFPISSNVSLWASKMEKLHFGQGRFLTLDSSDFICLGSFVIIRSTCLVSSCYRISLARCHQ